MEKVSKTLSRHMERIGELLSRMDVHEKSLPKIERDMLLAALRDMYDAVYMLDVDDDADAGVATDADAAPQMDISTAEEPEVEEKQVAQEPAKEEKPVVENESMSVLMADVDAEPIYAADPDLLAQEEQASQQPTIEEIEGQQNDDLFDEPEPQTTSGKEQPKTLWEKLNNSQKVGTIAEAVVATRTISDMYEDAASKPETTVHNKPETAASKQETIEQKPQQAEPKAEPKAEVTDPKPEAAEPRPEVQSKQPSLFDYFKNAADKPTQRTIADNLGAGKVNDVDRKLNANKVSDLRTVININDKFSFMNELFHNNMKGYNDFIMKLNALSDRAEAQAYVEEIARQYKWDEESLTVKTFYTIFDRKF